VFVNLTCSASHSGVEVWHFAKLRKVLLLAETAYTLYVRRDALRNEHSEKFLEDNHRDQGYYEGQKGFAKAKHPAALVVN
jgi:hypothetical protein